jgi:hypothetical protein
VRLVERSLVVHDSGTGRYRLLETLRQYGADRLVELGESGAARERYARYFLDLVARHGPAVSDHRHDDAVTALQADLENLRATADWLTRESRWREVHALCVDGSAFFSQFIAAEALVWLASALDNASPEDALASSDALGLAAMYAVNGEQFDRGLRYAERSLDVAARGGAVTSPWAHFAICMSAAVGVLPAEQGQRHTAAMERAASERGEPFLVSVAKSLAVMFATRLGQLGDVDRLTDEALAAALPLRNRTATSVALVTVAGALMFDRDPPEMERARSFLDAHAEEGLGAYGGLNVAWLLTYRALATYDRDPAAAAHDALESARFADRTGSEFATVYALEVLTAACAQLGLADEAAALGGHLSTRGRGLPVNSTYRSLVARRTAAVESVWSDARSAAPPVDRRALLALLARIERAIEEGTTPSERCVPT